MCGSIIIQADGNPLISSIRPHPLPLVVVLEIAVLLMVHQVAMNQLFRMLYVQLIRIAAQPNGIINALMRLLILDFVRAAPIPRLPALRPAPSWSAVMWSFPGRPTGWRLPSGGCG